MILPTNDIGRNDLAQTSQLFHLVPTNGRHQAETQPDDVPVTGRSTVDLDLRGTIGFFACDSVGPKEKRRENTCPRTFVFLFFFLRRRFDRGRFSGFHFLVHVLWAAVDVRLHMHHHSLFLRRLRVTHQR